MSFRDDVIKLAHDNPGEIRDALLPVLAKEARTDPADVLVGMLSSGGRIFDNLESKTKAVMDRFKKGQRQLEGSKRYTANGDFQVAQAHLTKVSASLKDLGEFALGLHKSIDAQTSQLQRL